MITKNIKNRQFIESNNPKLLIFDREYWANEMDIAACAALSMHKAIIGICGLQEIEIAFQKTNFNLRQSKAIQTYYVIYHLFVCCMLMDGSYRIQFEKDANGDIHYGSSIEDLRKSPESGDDWNQRKSYEEDLATRISHGDIKKYCGKSDNPPWYSLRGRANNGKLPTFLRILYDSFVNENSAYILYEKMAYIRDRTIYRPSHVAREVVKQIQTSLNVRNQIDSMPTAKQLYEIAKKIHVSICYQYRNNKQNHEILFLYMHEFSCGTVDCNADYAEKLCYSLPDLKAIFNSAEDDSVPTFFAQLMELYSQEEAISFYNQYWKDIITETKKIMTNG